MIYIEVDEGYAFDFLSILDVKLQKTKNEKTKTYRTGVYENICREIGKDLTDEIIASSEYAACIQSNSNMFDLVDKAKKDEVTARDVDMGNYIRCEAKRKLQEKYFSTKITEIKTGYEQYKKEI